MRMNQNPFTEVNNAGLRDVNAQESFQEIKNWKSCQTGNQGQKLGVFCRV
jgi:hypothetical protein